MFRFLAGAIPVGANALFQLHPLQLSAQLESAWALRVNNPNLPLGHPDHRSDLPAIPVGLLVPLVNNANQQFAGRIRWRHLAYAYMIEQTNVCEIFRKVVRDYSRGERLGTPLVGSEHWLRATEELIFRTAPPFFIQAYNSDLRPERGSIAQNAYARLLGMQIGDQAQDEVKGEAVRGGTDNTLFAETFDEFLREVWTAIMNANNAIGPNPLDDAKIANLAEKIHNMLTSRRQAGNLAREEFYTVSMMEWFHLTLQFNSNIVMSLRADASSPDQRLIKIGERVGLPAHPLCKSYFDVADAISSVLTLIETGLLNNSAAAAALYAPGTPLEQDMRTVITHWSILMEREVKAKRVIEEVHRPRMTLAASQRESSGRKMVQLNEARRP